MKTTTFTALLLLFSFPGFAQIDSAIRSRDVEEEIFEGMEDRISDDEEVSDLTESLEILLEYQHKKVNLNELPAEVAYTFLHFTDYQYYQLQLYIEKYGELVTLSELAAVEGFTREDAERISERVEVRPTKGNSKPLAYFFRKSRSLLLFRYGQTLEKQAGYDTAFSTPYLGNPLRLTFKYAFQSGEHFNMALSGEKDAGEQFFRKSQKQGFDHYAFFINIKNIGILKNLVLGDYTLSFGQGLIMGARSMGMKGGGAAQIRRFPSYIRATAPMNESDNQHGIAVQIGNAGYNGTIFYSHRYYDGTLYPTGYHRTSSEMAKRHAFGSHLAGGHFQLRRRIFETGITATYIRFSQPIPPSDALYKKFFFAGQDCWNAGADYKIILRKTILFGDVAVSIVPKALPENDAAVSDKSDKHHPVGTGILQGCILDLDPRSKLSALFRYYSRNFVTFNGSGFSAGSKPNNEIGIYLAADFVTGRKTALQFNFDNYRFPWLRFQTDRPCNGFDIGTKFFLDLSHYLSLQFQYQYYRKVANVKISDYYTSTTNFNRHKIRCMINCRPVDWLKLKTEADYLVNFEEGSGYKQGFLICQDIGIDIAKWNFSAKMRIAFFDTDSYNERIYAYEQDVLYTFTINSYYGKGVRYYLLLKYKYRFFDIQVRLSRTCFDDRSAIGSGQTLIQGKNKTDIRLQTIFHF